jgi:hypothetical protein
MSAKWFLAELVALVASAAPAAAHDWYPLECCHAMDCAPVEQVEVLAGPVVASIIGSPAIASPPGAMLVTTKHGRVLVPPNFPRRDSRDHQMHACMRPGEGGSMRLICIFIPPST